MKMKRTGLTGLLAILAILFAFGESMAGEKTKVCTVKDAEQFWQFNMPDKALACLDEVIDREPGNAKAYFLKGKYCLASNDYSCAKARFSAEPVRQEYGDVIASLYRAEADKKLGDGDIKTAEEFYGQAISFNSAVRQDITNRLFNICKGQNYPICSLTVRIAPEMKGPIADHFASASGATNNQDAKVDLKSMAAEYNPDKYGEEAVKDKEALGRVYLEKAKEFARQVGKDQLTEKYRALAKKYLGEAVVEQELPEVFILKPSEQEYEFIIKKGEKTPYWLWSEQGIRTNLHFSSTNRKYEIHNMNGSVIKIWAGDKFGEEDNEKFVIVAIEDTDVFIKVTKK